MHRFQTLACALTIGLTACATAPRASPLDTGSLDAAAERAVGGANFQGVALLLDRSGVRWRFASGSIDCASGRAVGEGDRFDMGSITKLFTATLILRLSERGEISLDDRLGDLLNDTPVDKAGISVRDLLFHRSGLRESSGDDETYISRDAMLTQEFTKPLLFAPGSNEAYSNVGYSVLAAIIERHYGARYEDVLRRELLTPMGADSVGYRHAPAEGADACGTWDERRYGSVRDYFEVEEPSWNLVGNGGLLTTPEDLARWFQDLIEGRILNAENTTIVQQALLAEAPGGRAVYRASGSNIVFTSLLARYVGPDFTFLLMTNNSRAPKERIMPYFDPALTALANALDPPE